MSFLNEEKSNNLQDQISPPQPAPTANSQQAMPTMQAPSTSSGAATHFAIGVVLIIVGVGGTMVSNRIFFGAIIVGVIRVIRGFSKV